MFGSGTAQPGCPPTTGTVYSPLVTSRARAATYPLNKADQALVNATDEQDSQGCIRRSHFAILSAVFLVLWAARLDVHLDFSGDSATYLILGQSLAEGKGYTLSSHPDQILDRRYPPAFPVLIAVCYTLSGYTSIHEGGLLIIIKAISAISVIIAGLVFARYLAGLGVDRILALFSVMAFLLHPMILDFANFVRTECIYLAISMVILTLIERLVRSPASAGRRDLAWLVFWLVLACYLRSIAYALVGAACLSLLLARKRREAMLTASVVGVCLLPWFVFRMATSSVRETYWEQFLFLDPSTETQVRTVWDIIDRIGPGIVSVVSTSGTVTGLMYLPEWAYYAFFPLVPVLGISLVAAGILIRLKNGISADLIYVGLYGVILILWPYRMLRFLVPLIPFLAFYGIVGLARCWEAASRYVGRETPHRWLIGAVTALFFAAVIPKHAAAIEAVRIPLDDRPLEDGLEGYLEAIRWVDANQPAASVILCTRPYSTYAYTGRKTLNIDTYPPDVQLARIDRFSVDIIIEDTITWSNHTAIFLPPVMEILESRERIELVMTTQTDPPTKVWMVRSRSDGAE